jgi:beta-lactamase superfamily II metal-dependent hydrolase
VLVVVGLHGYLAVVEQGPHCFASSAYDADCSPRSRFLSARHEIRGEQFEFDGARGEFLCPQILPTEIGLAAKNDDSPVFRVSFGSRSFLLPDDAEKAREGSILSESNGETLQSDVLKVGHHGSKNSTTPDFLAAVKPQLAVISAGEENSYGHPSPVLRERLQQAGVPTLRTDVDGAIHIWTDGKKLEVNCFVACPQINARINLPAPQPPQTQESSQKQ